MKVAVIGAGIAGLTAASELLKLGVEVDVFEKTSTVGGRLATQHLDWASIDVGAQYFTARDERFQQQVSQWQADNVVECWQFSPHCLTASGLTVKPDSAIRYVGTPDMNSIAKAMADHVEIYFNSGIESIQRTANGWSLLVAGDKISKECYDWVVVSLPAEQSKALLANTAIECQLKAEQVHSPCLALALATKGQVPEHIQGIFGDEIVTWVSRLSARPQRKKLGDYDDLWMLHFSSEWSESANQDEHINVYQVGLEWLSKVLKKDIVTALEGVHHYKHYWPYARLTNQKARPAIIADRQTGIAAIGDWTAGGRVEGAYLSGLDLVDYLLEINT